MSKKMKIPSVLRKKLEWPSCNHPKTLSFRADHVFKTLNSIFLDSDDTNSLSSSSDCTSTAFSTDEDTVVETIIQDVRSSERLFFEGGETSSILLNHKMKKRLVPFEESVALALESDDPYTDFKKSMAEMVESHGLEEWDRLEELLAWYLNMNAKRNHAFILGAFIDLLLKDKDKHHSPSHSTSSYSSADSSFSAPSSPLFSTQHH